MNEKQLELIKNILAVTVPLLVTIQFLRNIPKDSETLAVILFVLSIVFAIVVFITKKLVFIIPIIIIAGIAYSLLKTPGEDPPEPTPPQPTQAVNKEELLKAEFQKDINLFAKSVGDKNLKNKLKKYYKESSEIIIHIGDGITKTKTIEDFISELYTSPFRRDSFKIINSKFILHDTKFDNLELLKVKID